jgi:hypothetical protein
MLVNAVSLIFYELDDPWGDTVTSPFWLSIRIIKFATTASEKVWNLALSLSLSLAVSSRSKNSALISFIARLFLWLQFAAIM